MSPEAEHHKSKKRLYDLVLIPAEDAAKTKRLRLSLPKIIIISTVVMVLISTLIIVVFTYSPLGYLMPIGSKALEARYGKQYYELNGRVTMLMEELIRLKVYNIRLRKALGEKVGSDSSGIPVSEKDMVRVPSNKQHEQTALTSPRKPAVASYPMVVGTQVTVESSNRIVIPLILPMEGYLSRNYEPSDRHYGIDIASKTGTAIFSAADGHIIFSGYTIDDGNMIIVSHSGGLITIYKHCQSLVADVNTYVKRGDPIATMGNTGRRSYGPHLHFEVWKDGFPVNPSDYLLNINI